MDVIGRNIILITHMAFGCSLVGCLITGSSTLVVVLVTRPKTKYLEPQKVEGGKKRSSFSSLVISSKLIFFSFHRLNFG